MSGAPRLHRVFVPPGLPACELRMGRPSRGTAGGPRQRPTHGRSSVRVENSCGKRCGYGAPALLRRWWNWCLWRHQWRGRGPRPQPRARRQCWCIDRWGKYQRVLGRWWRYRRWRLGASRGGLHFGWAPRPVVLLPHILYVCMYVSTYLPFIYLSIYPICVSIYLCLYPSILG